MQDINNSAELLKKIIELEKDNDGKDTYNIKLSKVLIQQVKTFEQQAEKNHPLLQKSSQYDDLGASIMIFQN